MNYIINDEIVQCSNRNILLITKKDNKKKYIMYQYSAITEIEKNEIRMLLSLPYSENLLRCHDVVLDKGKYGLVVDYAPQLTLHHKIVQNDCFFPESVIWEYLLQMLYSVYPLHMNGIIHRNIKTTNFFLFDNGLLKLGGFKLCEYNNEASSLKSLPSTLNYFYAAPELINKETYDTNCDIWSIGACIHEMCFLKSEYYQIDNYISLLQGIIKPINKTFYSEELSKIISLMLKNNKSIRPTAAMLLNNPIIRAKIYNPMKYIDILSSGKGFIDNLKYLQEIVDVDVFIDEKKNRHSINFLKKEISKLDIAIVGKEYISPKHKKSREKRLVTSLNFNSKSGSFDNGFVPKANCIVSKIEKTRSVSTRNSKGKGSFGVSLKKRKLIKYNNSAKQVPNVNAELDLLYKKLKAKHINSSDALSGHEDSYSKSVKHIKDRPKPKPSLKHKIIDPGIGLRSAKDFTKNFNPLTFNVKHAKTKSNFFCFNSENFTTASKGK